MVTIRMGISGNSSEICRATSRPFKSGIWKSSKIMSGGFFFTLCKASPPVRAHRKPPTYSAAQGERGDNCVPPGCRLPPGCVPSRSSLRAELSLNLIVPRIEHPMAPRSGTYFVAASVQADSPEEGSPGKEIRRTPYSRCVTRYPYRFQSASFRAPQRQPTRASSSGEACFATLP